MSEEPDPIKESDVESKVVLLSIRPKYAEKLFNGTKRVELRRVKPKLKEGDMVFVYVSSPVKELKGQFEVEKVVEKPIDELWIQVRQDAGISRAEFYEYYSGADRGCGIYLRALRSIRNPISLGSLRELWEHFHPPRSYRYLSKPELDVVTSAITARCDGA
jgi:predicted transcriptional regulator